MLQIRPSWAAIWLIAVFAFIYGPRVGHGFVKDDFSWIARSELRSIGHGVEVLTGAPSGFFRPMVSLAFAANRPVCDLNARCYGLTNVLLAIACAVSIVGLARSLTLPIGAALFAAAIWAFNWHGIGMSVMWISGRTALILVLLSTLAARAFVRRQLMRAAALSFAAMLAKEEAILLPLVLIGWAALEIVVESRSARGESRSARGHERHELAHAAIVWPRLAWFTALSIACEGAYFLLRNRSGAFTPATAPSFYRPTVTLAQLADNLPEYVDRSATGAAVCIVLYALLAHPALRRLTPSAARIVRFGACWSAGMLAITVFLPVRSSLYACAPSVGVALAAAALVADRWPSVPGHRQRLAIVAGLALPLCVWPILSARTRNAIGEAELSTTTIAALRAVATEHGAGACILLRDDRSRKPSFAGAFGTLGQEAADLLVQPRVSVWIDPPPDNADLAGPPHPSHVDAVLALRDGIVRER